jgi:hypothetical protein
MLPESKHIYHHIIMKLFNFALSVILPTSVLAQEPTVALESRIVARNPSVLEKRAVSATVRVDGLRHRTCPKTSCDAPGQYPINKKITLTCYTRDGTTTENGDKYGTSQLTLNLPGCILIPDATGAGPRSTHRLVTKVNGLLWDLASTSLGAVCNIHRMMQRENMLIETDTLPYC